MTVSGTIGAALEAAELNIPALAVSLELEAADYHTYTAVDFSTAMHFTHLFAQSVLNTALPDDVDVPLIPMTSIHPAGVFQAACPLDMKSTGYRIRVNDQRGRVIERHDPYAYIPLLTEYDLHLFAEGRLYHAYDKLGAQVCKRTGDEAVPTFVERDFRKHLDCGILARCFERTQCPHCGHDFIIAFSCRARAGCPSCDVRPKKLF